MQKEEYIRLEFLKLTHYWTGVILFLGALLYLLFALVDHFVTPENFTRFFILRSAVAFILIAIALLNWVFNRKKISKIKLDLAIMTAAVVAAAGIEAMLLELGGHSSFYYAGLSLVVISALGIVPLNLTLSIINVGLVYLIYVVPIFLFDEITNLPLFISNNAFLTSTFILALAWRALEHKNLLKRLALQYDLDKDRKQLKVYSGELQKLVNERTKDLNKSELMFRSLFEHANDGIMLLAPNGDILNVNNKACEIHGFEKDSLIGTNIAALETEENRQAYRERMERILAGESLLFETQHYRKDGTRVTIEVSSRAIEVEGNIFIQSFQRDITDKQRLQAQLLHSQKMDSIGQLAGGIAHDFNNILASILGYTELILMNEQIEDPLSDRVKKIENVARRASQMVSKLLSFARRASFEAVPFNVNLVISDTLDMVSRLVPEGISIIKQLTEPLPAVKGDPSQMEQVIMNLVLNARDAMAEEGTLTVRTEMVERRPGEPEIAPGMKTGKYIKISVADTGAGIDPSDLPHIFEPFFTTKGKAKGTGLGLALVYGIIKGHKGWINVESRPGEGSLFEIHLPAASLPQVKKAIPDEQDLRGTGTILAIDDEPAVLEFIKDLLEVRGFKVRTAEDPADGIAQYAKDHEEIDLVITDIMMPSMDGIQVGERIRAINPRVKIITISGFSEVPGPVKSDRMLKKPFSGAKLLLAVREVLEEKDRLLP